jgi:acetyl-CoA/propionyl-CoA carboxylase biotin carboxyl carrier protein
VRRDRRGCRGEMEDVNSNAGDRDDDIRFGHARFHQDAAKLATSDHQIVWPLEPDAHRGQILDSARARDSDRGGEQSKFAWGPSRAQDHGEKQRATGLGPPRTAPPAAALGLVVGHNDRSFGGPRPSPPQRLVVGGSRACECHEGSAPVSSERRRDALRRQIGGSRLPGPHGYVGYESMFAKVLVANRGEIAVRVLRACRDLGIGTVAVFSDLDAGAVHLRHADEAYNIGGGPPAQSYLNIPNIMAAVRRSGADAVHPGYGFLAENGDFARAVLDSGTTWVGPAPDVIESMGDKTAARQAATDAGVPTVPGTATAITSPGQVRDFATANGFPVAIKATAGGGGKGFRVVHDFGDIKEALTGAAREASAYFSSPDVYLERYLEQPRHIEIQVLGDASGAVLSFPERDCSLQRRHQKLIEESPSPALDPRIREEMMAAAARVSKQVGYTNAGTCEFLLDADGKSFYFLEMNTRLQVEHPVTELVTGIDLVVAQLLIAAEEPIGFAQEDIVVSAHAIECRINAENPAKDFMPAPGTIGAYREPAGPGVRVDSGLESNSTVPQAYDPMISKVIAYGSNRDTARNRMLRALSEYQIEGIKTTIPFHRLMLGDDRFKNGDYHTGTVERELDLSLLEETVAPTPRPGEPDIAVRDFDVEVGGKRVRIRVRERLDKVVRRSKPKPPSGASALVGGTGEVLQAPMQGTIVKVLVEKGQFVEAGSAICVLEAMKMENSIVAHTSGTVEELRVEAGQSVETGSTIAVIR